MYIYIMHIYVFIQIYAYYINKQLAEPANVFFKKNIISPGW